MKLNFDEGMGLLIVTLVLLKIALFIAICYVAFHFILKWW